MGLDIEYQALPDHQDWWNRVLADEDRRELLALVPLYLRQGGNVPWAERIGVEVKELLHAFPGIDRRNLPLGRSWDRLNYLLSESRRGDIEPGGEGGDIEPDDDPGTIAIRGANAVLWDGVAVLSVQRIPIRYTPPATVLKVATFLEGIPDSEIRRLYDPVAMENAGVYHGASLEEWEDDLDDIRRLQQFYRNVAVHKEGVLVCLD